MRDERYLTTGGRIDNKLSEARIARNRARRSRELKRRLTVSAGLCAALIFTVIFAMCGVLSDAREVGAPEIHKYYTSVPVLPGDTPESFAESAASSEAAPADIDAAKLAREIRSINHLSDSETPLAGTLLIVPYFSGEFIE